MKNNSDTKNKKKTTKNSLLLFLTWKKAIPKDIPATIPRLLSIVLVTSEKQP